jgi:hypothetical protein
MAEEDSGGLANIGTIVPSLYYDLIARVCSGVPLLVVLFWDHLHILGEISWSKLPLLLGAGYIVGLALTPLSVPWVGIQILARMAFTMPHKTWRESFNLADRIAAKDKEAGMTLAKMQAEAVLCQVLFMEFLGLILLSDSLHLKIIQSCPRVCRVVVGVILGLSAFHRIIAYVVRANRLGVIYLVDPPPKPEEPS